MGFEIKQEETRQTKSPLPLLCTAHNIQYFQACYAAQYSSSMMHNPKKLEAIHSTPPQIFGIGVAEKRERTGGGIRGSTYTSFQSYWFKCSIATSHKCTGYAHVHSSPNQQLQGEVGALHSGGCPFLTAISQYHY